jgi:hypothetical protein
MKKKDLVKKALENSHLYSPEELAYFRLWLRARSLHKKDVIIGRKEALEKLYLSS